MNNFFIYWWYLQQSEVSKWLSVDEAPLPTGSEEPLSWFSILIFFLILALLALTFRVIIPRDKKDDESQKILGFESRLE